MKVIPESQSDPQGPHSRRVSSTRAPAAFQDLGRLVDGVIRLDIARPWKGATVASRRITRLAAGDRFGSTIAPAARQAAWILPRRSLRTSSAARSFVVKVWPHPRASTRPMAVSRRITSKTISEDVKAQSNGIEGYALPGNVSII
jgi:hypothetical protein